MSKALRASPEWAATFRAHSCIALSSKITEGVDTDELPCGWINNEREDRRDRISASSSLTE